LTARRVGYKPKSTRVTISTGRITQDFLLEANPLQLGEVVVTGPAPRPKSRSSATSATASRRT